MKNTLMPNISLNSLGKQLPFFFKQVFSISLFEIFAFSLLILEVAFFVFAASLVLPVIMIGVGKIFLINIKFYSVTIHSGISNLEECPLNRNIPVFVLVGGAIASLKLLQVLWKQYNRRREPAEEEATDTHNGSVEFLFSY